MKADQPLLLVICGPNGAGKTTLRETVLGGIPFTFVNPDDIVLAASGSEGTSTAAAYEEAARIAEQLRKELLSGRCSFGFETVLSDPVGAKVEFIRAAGEAGYWVVVHFVGLDTPERSLARVIQRVENGGHDVPDEKIAGRFPRVIANLRLLLDVPDDLVIYDNSSAEEPFRIIAKLSSGSLTHLSVRLPEWMAALELETRRSPQTLILP